MPKQLRPFLGPLLREATDIDTAFPHIDELDISIEQNPYGEYLPSPYIQTFTKATVEREIRCVNPKCKEGGLDLQNILAFHPNGTYMFPCNGHEGPQTGRPGANICNNIFNVKVLIKRR